MSALSAEGLRRAWPEQAREKADWPGAGLAFRHFGGDPTRHCATTHDVTQGDKEGRDTKVEFAELLVLGAVSE